MLANFGKRGPESDAKVSSVTGSHQPIERNHWPPRASDTSCVVRASAHRKDARRTAADDERCIQGQGFIQELLGAGLPGYRVIGATPPVVPAYAQAGVLGLIFEKPLPTPDLEWVLIARPSPESRL